MHKHLLIAVLFIAALAAGVNAQFGGGFTQVFVPASTPSERVIVAAEMLEGSFYGYHGSAGVAATVVYYEPLWSPEPKPSTTKYFVAGREGTMTPPAGFGHVFGRNKHKPLIHCGILNLADPDLGGEIGWGLEYCVMEIVPE